MLATAQIIILVRYYYRLPTAFTVSLPRASIQNIRWAGRSLTERVCRRLKESNKPPSRTKEHQLIDIIAIAICVVICGAEGWVDIEMFGNSKIIWLKTFLELPNGIPSHDTFGRVFSMIDAQEFQAAFYGWVRAVYEITQGQIINIDGKRLGGSQDQRLGKKAIYMVSAWAEENHLVLGQRKVDEKSN